MKYSWFTAGSSAHGVEQVLKDREIEQIAAVVAARGFEAVEARLIACQPGAQDRRRTKIDVLKYWVMPQPKCAS